MPRLKKDAFRMEVTSRPLRRPLVKAQGNRVPRPSVNTWHFRVPSIFGLAAYILSPDRPAAGIRYNDSRLKSLPRYRGLLAIALLSLARRPKVNKTAARAAKIAPPRLTGVYPRKRLFKALDHARRHPVVEI